MLFRLPSERLKTVISPRLKIHYKSPETATGKINLPFERTLNSLSMSCIIRPPGTTVPYGLMFYPWCFFSFFSPRFLRDPSTDRPETLPHTQNLAVFYKLTSKIRGVLPQKNLGAKSMQNFGQFWTTSDFDREYLRNEATYPKSERRTNSGNFSSV